MPIAIISWLIAIPLLGLANGLRTLTPIAVLCWFAHLGYLPVQGTWAAWTAHPAAVAVFTLLALAEIINDKLARTGNRTAPIPLTCRIVFGALVGSIASTALHSPALGGALFGAIGAALGTFIGFMLRRDLVKRLGCPDWPIAIAEDLCTILSATFALHLLTS